MALSFVLPPAAVEPTDILSPIGAQDARHLKLDVKCLDCPFPLTTEDAQVSWEDGFDSKLVCYLSGASQAGCSYLTCLPLGA